VVTAFAPEGGVTLVLFCAKAKLHPAIKILKVSRYKSGNK